MNYKTIVVQSNHEADKAAMALSKSKVLGFDMEWKPEFTSGRVSPIALIQLANYDTSVVFPLVKLNGMPTLLQELLENPAVIKVGCGTAGDETKLLREYRIEVASLVDVNDISRRIGVGCTGLKNLADVMLQVVLPKSSKTTMSNWERWPLTDKQIQYAAQDAVITRRIYMALMELPLV